MCFPRLQRVGVCFECEVWLSPCLCLAITSPYIPFFRAFGSSDSRFVSGGSLDLDQLASLAPSRPFVRTAAQTRKNPPCTRGVVVYLRDVASVSSILGEVIIQPKVSRDSLLRFFFFSFLFSHRLSQTTMAEVRQMIRDELGLASPFVLRKNSIPLPRNQDTKLACWFFSASDDVLIVVPCDSSTGDV